MGFEALEVTCKVGARDPSLLGLLHPILLLQKLELLCIVRLTITQLVPLGCQELGWVEI